MKAEIKYTHDGRKVAVIGRINQTEYIVQEIFVTKSGDEIPSGENFTAKTLHDEPMESWKSYELRSEKIRASQLKDRNEKLDREIRALDGKLATMKDVFKFSSALSNNEHLASKLDMLNRFASGRCRWAVKKEYGIDIADLFDEIEDRDTWSGYRKHDGIKLVSLFGNSNGDLEFRINGYRDGSGLGWEEIEFFETKPEALARAREIAVAKINEGRFNYDAAMQLAAKGVEFSRDELAPLIAKKRASLEDSLNRKKIEFEKETNELTSKLAILGKEVES
jgi:hypothetical protein